MIALLDPNLHCWVSGIGWLTTRLHKLRADTSEVRLSLASRKSAAALQTEKKPAFEMAGLLSVLLPRWYLVTTRLLDDGWCAGEIPA